ncbi:MAG: endopeptidase La [Elusimicrobia bacterium RIFOXYA2_FULL_50_26]|nr:MAG: endopeptidase La [Elusimicrobia bacterium RIFOXYA2_FULL_50_26]OGS24503.1 MAG: endopeptidase La [Elusimicrobia bacterium RIFOXYB2_FULL_50_12]
MENNDIDLDSINIPNELPILPLRGTVIFPSMIIPITIGRAGSVRLVEEATAGNRIIGVAAQKNSQVDEPHEDDVYSVGTAIHIMKMLKMPDDTIQLLVQGFSRIHIEYYTQNEPYFRARIKPLQVEEEDDDTEAQALRRNILATLEKIASLSPQSGTELYTMVLNIKKPGRLADLVVSSLNLSTEQQQDFLETLSVKERLKKLHVLLGKELQLSEISSKIQTDMKERLDKTQREYILREQLKAIQKELGEGEEQSDELRDMRNRIKSAKMPRDVEKEAEKETDRMSKIPPASPEYTVARTYLEWLVTLPWSVSSEDNLDIRQAQRVLDEDHYDLKKIKERILEFLAVRRLKKDTKGPILCFVGPPGVGKTSLGKSIARAMGRKFMRISLGGIRDEADIRGHRRTYIGSLPGRIIQGIKRAGSNNPVFMMDEVDKIGIDFRGDPASALLEVLDPEQNNSFVDHYLDVPFDLSHVMFITTANVIYTIPPPLLDRMEILSLPGYTEEEKLKIAQEYLVPRQIDAHGLPHDKVRFEDKALGKITRDYTREAGLRNLEREIATICRKLAAKYARDEVVPFIVNENAVSEFLGPVQYFSEVAERIKQPGVAIGLAWTQAGGDIIFIEATKMRGKKILTLTGQLGQVMKESAQAAFSYIRSKADELHIADDFFEKYDVHIHIPAGAIPKDGPSAGITMAVALASLLTGRTVQPYCAMTGEITLRGNILPVGGVKEKVLAARRAGITTVLLPDKNRKDLEEIPDEVRKSINFVFIETIQQAFGVALEKEKIPVMA